MTYRTKITASVVMLALGVVAMAGVAYWGANRAQYNLERSHHAHEEYAAYLALSAETFRLFKQIRRDLMDGAGEPQFDVAAAKAGMLRKLELIEAETQAELALGLRQGEEAGEAERLAALTEQIGIALAEVTEVEKLLRAGERDRAIALLSTTLEHRIDRQVSAIIDAGLADEREEVEEAKRVTDALAEQLKWISLIVVLTAASFAALSVWILLARLRQPLEALEEGTMKISEGRFDHSIGVAGDDEFATLARHFNAMAGQLGRQRRALDDAQRTLQRQVAERTAELSQAVEQLNQRDRTRSRFFADVSHELRTPITVMRGLAEVALRSRQDHEAAYRTALGRVVEVSGQQTRLVNDLLLIARSDAGALDFQKAPVDLAAVAETVIQDMRPLYAQAGATLQFRHRGPPIIVAGDRERLRQLLAILVDNAVKHGPDGVVTTVELAEIERHGTLRVVDNGYGIETEELDKVFDRFYSSSRGSERSKSGSGLGLPIAQSLVRAHGGRIEVESEPGTGTRFTIVFPPMQVADGPEDGSTRRMEDE